MKSPISILWYGIALIFPVIFCVALTDNINESKPWVPFVMCPILMAIAAYLSFKPIVGDKIKFLVWSVIAGFIEAAMLVFMA